MHVLLVNHGKRCPRCAKNGKPRKESDGACPLFGKNGIASVKKRPTDSADDLIKSEEALSDNCEESAKTAHGKQAGTVKQQSSENDVKQEPSEAAIKQEHDAHDSPAKQTMTVKQEGS